MLAKLKRCVGFFTLPYGLNHVLIKQQVYQLYQKKKRKEKRMKMRSNLVNLCFYYNLKLCSNILSYSLQLF